MKKYIFSLIVVLALLAIGFCFINQPSEEKTGTTRQTITKIFSEKYNKPADDLVINVVKDDGLFAKGSINIKNEPGGGMWFAAKTDKGWELAFDGNGIISCLSAEKYELPAEMVPQCLDTQNNVIER